MNTFFPSVQYLQQYQPQNQLDQMQKVAAIRSSQQQEQQSAQAFPIEQQQRQEQLTTSQLANQQTRIQMQDKQGIAQALRDSYGGPQAGSVTQQISPSLGTAAQSGAAPQSSSAAPATAQPQSSTAAPAAQAAPTNPTDRLNALITRVQDPKYGVSAQGQMALIQQLTELGQKAATFDKTTNDNVEQAHKIISQGLNSVLEAPPEDQAAQWTLERNELLRHPTLGKFLGNIPAQYPGQPVPGGSPEAQSALHSIMAEQDIVAAAKLPGDKADAQRKVLELPGGAMNPVTMAVEEAKQKAPIELATKVAEEIDPRVIAARSQQAAQTAIAVEKARQSMYPAALAGVQPQLIQPATADATKADQAFTQAQQAGNEMADMVKLAKAGNKVAYAYSPVTGVLQINVAGQIKRMNMPEIESYGAAGSALDKVKGFLGKQATGASIPDDVLNDMATVSNMVTKGARTKYEQDISGINSRYGAKFQPMANQSSAQPQSGIQVGDVKMVKGRQIKVTKVYPDGSFDGDPQ